MRLIISTVGTFLISNRNKEQPGSTSLEELLIHIRVSIN